MGSKTIGANSPTLTAQSKRTLAPGSMIVTRVPMCNTDGFKRSGSGSQEELKSKVAVPSMRNSYEAEPFESKVTVAVQVGLSLVRESPHPTPSLLNSFRALTP